MKKIILVFGVLIILMLTACNGKNDGNIEASGNIEATNIVVSSQVAGKVIHILKDEGEEVNKGDTVIIIDPETYELKLQEALAVKELFQT